MSNISAGDAVSKLSLLELDSATLQRLHAVFFPERPVPAHWYERLALLLKQSGADGVDLMKYIAAIRRHEDGVVIGHPAVTASMAPAMEGLTDIGSRLTLLVDATDGRRLAPLMEFYLKYDLPVVFAIGDRTDEHARALLTASGAATVKIDGAIEGAVTEEAGLDAVPTDWVLSLRDDELPSPGLLHFVQNAVNYSPEFVWGFARVPCRYDPTRNEVEYSQFLPFGPLASDRLDWRLAARGRGPKQRRTAMAHALILDFGWIARSLAERVGTLQDSGEAAALELLPEAVPELWHMFTPLPGEPCRNIARALWRSSSRPRFDRHEGDASRTAPHTTASGSAADSDSPEAGLRAAACFMESSGTTDVAGLAALTSEEVVAWRDRIVARATEHMNRHEFHAARQMLQLLEFATIDDRTLELTDAFLPHLAEGRSVVATVDPGRRPRHDEIVIIYGNYPHAYANLVTNNPVRRHLADFWRFRHDRVESDPRWNGIDRIYVINADERLDRWDGILRELASVRAPLDRVQRISACKPAPGELDDQPGRQLACLRSHIEALRHARADRLGHVLILEDDFCFTSDVETHLTDLQTFVQRGYDFWICLVATSKYGALVPRDDLLSMSFQACTNTGGYIASAEGRRRLIPVYESAADALRSTGDTITYAVDRCWAVLQPSGKFLVFRRKFGFQGASFSDIERSIARYLD